MVRKLLTVGVIAILAQVLFLSAVFADTSTGYDASKDTYLSVNTGTGAPATGSSTGTSTFQAQEGAYQTTGTSVKHDYIWVQVNGSNVAAIDPPCIYQD